MLNTLRYLVLPVLNASGPVFVFLGLALLLPYVFSALENDGVKNSFLICSGLSFALGFLLSAATRRYKRELTARHGFLLVTLIWTAVPLFSTLPFLIEMPEMSFAQLYFEMMSCLSTTGATVINGLDQLPISLNGWRCFLSWIGGMGLIVLSVAVLPLLGVGGSQIMKAEISGPLKENRLTPRIADTAKALYIIYLGLSFLCAFAYHTMGMSWADAIMHMMTTVSLSGISTHDASFAFFNSPAIDAVAVVFMMLSGFNYSLHFLAWRRHSIKGYFGNTEARTWMLILAVLSALTVFVLQARNVYDGWDETLRYAVFTAVSCASSTGYSNTDYSLWPFGMPIILMICATFASCAGSTGGGFKLIRLIITLKILRREMVKLLYPKAVVPLTLDHGVLESKVGFAVLVFLQVWILTFVCGAALLLLSGLPPTEAVSSSLAMLSNLGPGLGSVGPAGNYSQLTVPQLWICSLLMLSGRLEIFTVFVLFTKDFWKC